VHPWLRQPTKVEKIAALLGIAVGAVAALQLCREAMRDWCPPGETARIVAALVGLESRARKGMR
jgi:surfactin synthase thioesterase subunit